MKARAALIGIALFSLVLVGCARRHVVPGAEVTEEGVVIYEGRGTSVVARPDDPLAVEEAKLAAATMARADLLQKVKGSFTGSEVHVDGLMLEAQEAFTKTDGFLSGVEVHFLEHPETPEPEVITAIAILRLPKRKFHARHQDPH